MIFEAVVTALSPADMLEALLWCAALATWLMLLAAFCIHWKRGLPPILPSIAKIIRRVVEIGLRTTENRN